MKKRLCVLAILCVGRMAFAVEKMAPPHSESTQATPQTSPQARAESDAKQWERVGSESGWLPHPCADTAVSEDVGDNHVGLLATTSTGKPISFCYGGQDQCTAEGAKWKDGTTVTGKDGTKVASLRSDFAAGKQTILTLKTEDNEGKPCYRSVILGHAQRKGYLAGLEEHGATLASFKKIPLPKPTEPSPEEKEFKALNALRAQYGLAPIEYSEEKREEYRKINEAPLAKINQERAANKPPLKPVRFSFYLAAAAITNNQLKGRKNGLHGAHRFYDGFQQAWGGYPDVYGSIKHWVHHDADWNWAHKAIVMKRDATEAGFGITSDRQQTFNIR